MREERTRVVTVILPIACVLRGRSRVHLRRAGPLSNERTEERPGNAACDGPDPGAKEGPSDQAEPP
jgi:hypothetical protein